MEKIQETGFVWILVEDSIPHSHPGGGGGGGMANGRWFLLESGPHSFSPMVWYERAVADYNFKLLL